MAKKVNEPTELKRYNEFKQKNPDTILLIRVGDLYETFSADAKKVSEILDLPVHCDTKGKLKGVDRVGFPHDRLDVYLSELVRAGIRVAICEKIESPNKKQTEVKVMETISPNQAPSNSKNDIKAGKSEIDNATRTEKAPQFVTVNGDKITHGHIFQHAEKEAWLFSVRVNGKQLPAVQLSTEESQRFSNLSHENRIADAVRELMGKYYPSKLERHLSKEEFTNGVTLSDGRKIDKFNVYKENNPDMKGYGKWHFYVDVGGVKMSQVGDRDSLNAYFDKSRTPAQITEKMFGEKLHLASAYKSYVLPDGVKDIRIAKSDGKQWCISAEIDGVRTPKRNLSYDDGVSFFSTHTATKEQLAAKYLTKDINEIRNQREHVSNSMKI